MKNIFVCLILSVMLVSCNQKMPNYVIVIDSKTDSTTLKSAEQLQKYWKQVFNQDIEIKNALSKNQKPIFIGKEHIEAEANQKLAKLKTDAFYIRINSDTIFLAGKNSKGNIYAVNTFLEEQLGCIKLSSSEDYLPNIQKKTFTDYVKFYTPAFNFRRILLPSPLASTEYRDWYKLHEIEDWGMFVHTFHKLLPPDVYFKEHSEYYSLVNGKRLKDAQLCLSNPEVINLLIKNLQKEIDKQPEKTYWSVSQNDAYNYCECENCKKLYDKYGSISGVYVDMANKISQAFPNKQISTLAYQFTRSAPKNIKPLPNVNIMFCSIECNRSMPLQDDKRSVEFVNDLKNWCALTSNIFMWDYVVQFKNYLTPFPNFHVLQPNIKLFSDNGVDMMFQQGSGTSWSDLAELKQYLIAKLLWNPDIDIKQHTHNFLSLYYGKAASYIEEYHKITTEELQKQADKVFLNIYGYPNSYKDSYLTPELIIKYDSLMLEAKNAVKNDSVLTDRVTRAALPVDFSYIDLAINNQFDNLPAILTKNNKKEINGTILEKLDEIEKYAEKNSSILINERIFKITDYKKYAIDKLNLMLANNMLSNAEVLVKTTYSDTYPVGGAKALTDGLFGSLNFAENWLGFHGEDMFVQINFSEQQTVNQISMNFLKAVNSWVFLPEQIKIESSTDGNSYETIELKQNDLSDQNYLVKSVPFCFKFSPLKTKYLRIKAKSIKTCPIWHRGFGNPSWIFIDEIVVTNSSEKI